jgi:hypothetical protein
MGSSVAATDGIYLIDAELSGNRPALGTFNPSADEHALIIHK